MLARVISLIISIVALMVVSYLATISPFFARFVWPFDIIVGLLALALFAWIIIDIVNSFKGK